MPTEPSSIRVSVGTASCLNLNVMKLDAAPTTAYLMLYHKGKCIANCAFCSQARESKSRADKLSRVQWPEFDLNTVIDKFKHLDKNNPIKRICIQVINYPNFIHDLISILKLLRLFNIPISVSCQPIKEKYIYELYNLGIDRIGIPFDTATPELFFKIKGYGNKSPYKWEKHFQYLQKLIKIFGPDKVTTHLVVGLGETEKEDAEFIQKFKDIGITTGLFAFTPIKGTKLENFSLPSISHYRRIQLARFLIINNIKKAIDFIYDELDRIRNFGLDDTLFNKIIMTGKPFQTSGCPYCNRPYYNERPGKKLFNYPRKLTPNEINDIYKDLGEYL
ncbi:MAG: radical SAM protein [Candidatus Helarchaeota archaeon]